MISPVRFIFDTVTKFPTVLTSQVGAIFKLVPARKLQLVLLVNPTVGGKVILNIPELDKELAVVIVKV